MSIPVVRADKGGRYIMNTVPASGTNLLLDLSEGSVHDITLDSDCTLEAVHGAVQGVSCEATLIIRQDSIGGHTLSWSRNFVWPDDHPIQIQDAAYSVTIFTITSIDGGFVWYGQLRGEYPSTMSVDPLSVGLSDSHNILVSLTNADTLSVLDDNSELSVSFVSYDTVDAGLLEGAGNVVAT